MGGSLAPTRPRVTEVDSLARKRYQGVTLDSLALMELNILHLMDERVKLDLWSIHGLRFKGFMLAAVLEIFDGAARWSGQEPELVAVEEPEGSSTTREETFPFVLGPIKQ